MNNRWIFNLLAYIFYIIGYCLIRLVPAMYAGLGVITGLVLIVIGIILNSLGVEYNEYNWNRANSLSSDARNRRQAALKQAQIFLLPYKDIWRNLTLSNKYCRLTLRADGVTIVGTEKLSLIGEKPRSFKVLTTGILDTNEFFNLFCKHFEYNTSYNGLVELCNACRAVIQ